MASMPPSSGIFTSMSTTSGESSAGSLTGCYGKRALPSKEVPMIYQTIKDENGDDNGGVAHERGQPWTLHTD